MMETTDYEGLLRRLVDLDVGFVIVGGAAAIIHGSARLTEDLDIVYQRTEENIRRLVRALADLAPYPRGAPPGLPFQWSERTVRNGLNFTLNTSLGQLDLLGEIAGGGTYEALVRETVDVTLFGMRCRCLSLDALIRAKRAAGRPKDHETIAELEALWEGRHES